MFKAITDYVAMVSAYPFGDNGLAYDATGGLEHWVTLPAGGPGVQFIMDPNLGLDQLTFKVEGGSNVTPATSSSSNPFWYTTYTAGSTPGTACRLHLALDDGSGTPVVTPQPLLTFDVKPRRELKVTIQPIGRLVPGSATPISPESVPEPAALKAYLDSVFGPQANVYTTVNPIRTQVNVVFDVGLGAGYGDRGKTKDSAGVLTGDDKLSILQGSYGRRGSYSDEETAILKAANAGPDPDAAITIYWVACDGLESWEWADIDAEQTGSASALRAMSCQGQAGKAMKSKQPTVNPGPRVIWIAGCSEATFNQRYATSLHVAAHELGHALGDVGHTVEKYLTTADGKKQQIPASGNVGSFSAYSDNTLRLMSGMPGLRRYSGPKQLNKVERDRIQTFFTPGSN